MGRVVVAISGSLRKESYTTKLLRAFEERKPEDVEFVQADISQLPMFNEDVEIPEPEAVIAFKNQIAPAYGILLLTPEYNRSYTPVMKNALDWGSRPKVAPGHTVWGGKPAALAGCSPYMLGAFGAVHHLRQVLTFLNMPTLQQPEFYMGMASGKFDENGVLTDQVTIEHIEAFWPAFVGFMDKINSQIEA